MINFATIVRMNNEMYTGVPALLELTRAIMSDNDSRPKLRMIIADRLNTRGIIYDRGSLNSLSSSYKEGKLEKVEFGVIFDNEPEQKFEWRPTPTGDLLQDGWVTGIGFVWTNEVQALDKKTFKTLLSGLPDNTDTGEIEAIKRREEELRREDKSGRRKFRGLSIFRTGRH